MLAEEQQPVLLPRSRFRAPRRRTTASQEAEAQTAGAARALRRGVAEEVLKAGAGREPPDTWPQEEEGLRRCRQSSAAAAGLRRLCHWSSAPKRAVGPAAA